MKHLDNCQTDATCRVLCVACRIARGEEQMTMLEAAILDTLSALTAPISASKLLLFTMCMIPTARLSWSDFVDCLNDLVAEHLVIEDERGYHTKSESETLLEQLGL